MLAWFRRHAKVLMVVLGSAAMAIFGLGPVFNTLQSGGGGADPRETEVVATWKGGEITRAKLDLMEMRHYQAQRFLSGVQQAAAKEKGDGYNSLAIPISPIRDGQREMIDDQLITRFLMAERAKEEGMIVSDGMVNDYLTLLSGDAGFTTRDLDAINDTVNNRYCSLNAVRERLKTELLANQMQLCCMTAVPIVPNPIESMELFGRTMEQIECEVLPIEVEPFINKVTETPSPAEIKSLYEKGKYEFADPSGERPGFKIGRKINLQYLVADFETYLLNEMNKLSDEDVQKEYDRLVAEKNEMVLEPLPVDDGSIQINDPPPGEGQAAPGDVSPPTTEGEGTAPTNSTSDESASDVAPPPSAETSKENADPQETDSNSESAKEDAESTTDEELNDNSQEATEGKSEESDQSFNVRSSGLQFVSTAIQEESTQEKTTQEESGQEQAGQEDSSDVESGSNAAKQEDPNAAGSSEQVNDQNLGNQADPKNESNPQDEAPGSLDSIIKASDDDGQAEPKPVDRTPKPLKDVVDDVKRSMCQEAANEAMTKAITQASVIVQDHFEKRMRWEYNNDDKKLDEPAPLDHQALAEKYNLIAKETGLVDQLQIADDPLGQVRKFMPMVIQGRQAPQLVPIGQLVFSDFNEMRLYDAKEVNDSWGSRSNYLYWAAKKTETRVPSLDEAKPEVLKFWKNKKALEMAMAEAESIKEKVKAESGKKLSDLFAERALQTGAFTWFSSFGSTRYSSPIGVNNAGEDFMETAFGLAQFEVGVAANETKDTIYVVQAVSEARNIEEVGAEYLETQYFKFKRIPNEVQQVAQIYFQEFNYTWNQEFQDTMELKFVNR